jgi:O-antigen ligase
VATRRKAKVQPEWHWYVMLACIFFEYVRPQDYFLPFLQPLRLPGILTLVATFIFFTNDKKYVLQERVFVLMLVFMFVCAETIVFSPNTRAVYNKTITLFWTYVAFVFPLFAVVTSYERYRFFFKYWIFLQTMLAIQVVMKGGTGPGSYLWDENDVAMAIDMAIPYAAYMAFLPGMAKKHRLLLLLAVLICIAGVGVSASRGGMVGMVATIIVVLLISRRPIKNLMLAGLLVAAVIPIVLSNLPDAYKADMENINNPEDSTRDERLWSWSIGWVMFQENPIFGVGAGNYDWTNHLYAHKSPMYTPKRKIMGGRAAHSLYFTLLPELGMVGVVVYVSIISWVVRRFFQYRKFFNKQENPTEEMIFYMTMLKAMLGSGVAFLVAGAFITVLYYPPYWHLIGFFVLTIHLASKSFPEFGEMIGGPQKKRRRRAPPAEVSSAA